MNYHTLSGLERIRHFDELRLLHRRTGRTDTETLATCRSMVEILVVQQQPRGSVAAFGCLRIGDDDLMPSLIEDARHFEPFTSTSGNSRSYSRTAPYLMARRKGILWAHFWAVLRIVSSIYTQLKQLHRKIYHRFL